MLFAVIHADEMDFVPLAMNVTFFPELPSEMCVDIHITDDDIFDPGESFVIRVLPFDANVIIVNGTQSKTEVFIIDNDGIVTLLRYILL